MSLEHKQIVIASPQSKAKSRKLSTILLRRRLRILGVSSIVMSVASVLALTAKPTYQSTIQILVSSKLNEGVQLSHTQKGAQSNLTDSDVEVIDYTTQQKLMLSSKLIQKAVDLLHSEYPYLTVEHIKGKKGQQGPLVITPLEQRIAENKAINQVFEISFKDNDAVRAQKILQSLQKIYQEHNIERRKQSLSRGLTFINQRLSEVKDKMNQAERNLEKFRKKHHLIDPQQQGKILLESLADITKQIRITRAHLKDLQARYDNLKQELSSLSKNELISFRLSQSTRYQALLNEIQKTDLALAQERLRYTDNYPEVQKLIQQRRTQVTLLQQEIERTVGDKAGEAISDNFFTQKSLDTKILSGTKEAQQTARQVTEGDFKLVEEFIKVQTAVLGLRANEKSLANSEAEIRAELTKYPSLIAEYNRLLPEVETNRKTLEQLMVAQQSLGLKMAQRGFNFQVLEEPQVGTYFINNKKLFLLLGGMLLGPIFGIAAALISESNNIISSPEELQSLTNLRLLGAVPKLPHFSTRKRLFHLPLQRIKAGLSSQPISDEKQLSVYGLLPSHETLDMVYQNIRISKSSVPYKSVMLTSAISGEGKSTLALGLAMSATRMHQRVLLIDANLRQPNLHKILGLTNDWGLSLLLVEETNSSAKEYIQPIHPSIDVLTAGPTPEDIVKLLSSARMKELLEFFKQTYDVVMIDTSSIIGTVDARIVASLCDGIVMVGRMDQVTCKEVIQATEILSNLNLIGMIANGTERSL
ncbi:tyrosine-protein kinase domain-containing protein [Brasilonema sp. UFV-L1]|uniref:GumC family protein n=1 Tax=Brasilonema sp. UFV-L1 TaxID=2234130 RepID=UPI00145EB95D|nr:tyrosine-protein kinase domain-containing protein [Brasilonema sp. UFV-L1]NMG10580.1 chain-length determining protein [Brasilonema sp. UFV-L1]